MFGYASNDNEAMLPAPIYYAHEILKDLKEKRNTAYKFLLPDAKSQVSLQYEGGKVKRADQIVVSTQHTEGSEQLLKSVVGEAVNNVMGDLIDETLHGILILQATLSLVVLMEMLDLLGERLSLILMVAMLLTVVVLLVEKTPQK